MAGGRVLLNLGCVHQVLIKISNSYGKPGPLSSVWLPSVRFFPPCNTTGMRRKLSLTPSHLLPSGYQSSRRYVSSLVIPHCPYVKVNASIRGQLISACQFLTTDLVIHP